MSCILARSLPHVYTDTCTSMHPLPPSVKKETPPVVCYLVTIPKHRFKYPTLVLCCLCVTNTMFWCMSQVTVELVGGAKCIPRPWGNRGYSS